MKIGVFDSGVGGLSVLKSLIGAKLFSEIIYYGDTARVPYGNKDKATITRFSLEAVEFFLPHKIDMLIVACNTASAYALDKMQKIAPFPVIGVVEAGILSLSNKIKNKKDSILIIATKATIKSGIYERKLRKMGYENITSLQTGLFVPLVEEGVFEGEVLESVMRHYFDSLNLSWGEGNSPLDLHSADLANRHKARTQSPLSLCRFTKNHESQTENPSVVDSAKQNLIKNKSARSANPRKSFCYFLLSQKVESSLPYQPQLTSDSTIPQNLNQNKSCVSTQNSPVSWCKKSGIKGAEVPPADFLLETEQRGTPPKSEKAAAFWRVGGEWRGVQPFLRQESGENEGEESVESTAESSAKSALDSTIPQNLKKSFCYFWLRPKVESSIPYRLQTTKRFCNSAESALDSTHYAPKAIILACTHFPLIAPQISAFFDNKPILIHSGDAIVEFLLKNYKLDSAKKRTPKVHFYASADKAALQKTAKLWLGTKGWG